jgi:uncharacterized protein
MGLDRSEMPQRVRLVVGAAVLLTCCMAGLARPLAGAAGLALHPAGRVNDFAGVMEAGARQRLEQALDDLEQRTGAEVAVVTVDTVPDGDVDKAAVELFEAWGIGKKHRDNGVLILCAVRDKRIRIEVGYGLEAVLPDARTGRIIDTQMLPAFRRGDLTAGLVRGALAVADVIAGAGDTGADRSARRRPSTLAVLLVAVLILAILLVLLTRSRHSRPWVYPWRRRDFDHGWPGGFPPGGFGGSLGRDGGFGGFGGGLSGGGGASRGW